MLDRLLDNFIEVKYRDGRECWGHAAGHVADQCDRSLKMDWTT